MHETSREEPAIPQITYRKACVLQLFFILSVVLWGCTVPQSVPDPPVAEVTFVALTANWEHYVNLADAFNAQHPGLRVHVIDPASLRGPTPGDEVQQAVRVADAVLMAEVDLTLTSNTDIFRDLTTLVQREGDLAPHDFYPSLLHRFQEHGSTPWGIPLGVSPLLLAYDRTRFDAAGVPHPEPGWSWDQFLATAQQLTDPAQAQWGFAGFTPGSFDLAAFILQHGGTLVEDGRPALDTPRNAEALAWVADLARVHGVMPSDLSPPQPAAMWLQRPGGSLRTTTGLAPLPEDARYAALDIVYGGHISAGSQAPEAAWQWLLYLTHQPPPHELLPARPSVLESTVDPSDAGYAAYPYALERVAPEPWHDLQAFSAAWTWLADAGLAALLAGSAAAPDVLHDAQSLALESPASPPPTGSLPTSPAGPPPTVAQPPRADPTTLRTLVLDRYTFEEVARHYVASLDIPTSITVEGFASGVTYPPEKRAEFDVFAAPPNFRAEEVAGHWFMLDPFVESDGAFGLDDFYPRALDTYTRDGKLWALPTDLDTLLLFYNPAAFDAVDLPYPDGTWTWEDLAAAAEQLSTGENWERHWGLVTPMTGWESLPLIRAAQQIGRAGPLVDDPERPRAPTLNREAVVEGVHWYAALTQDRQVLAPPALYYRDWQASLDLIASGRAAMWISTVGMGQLPGASGGIGVALLPVTGSPYTTMGVTGYGISAHSAQPEAAWQWLVHLTQQPALVRGLPARRSLLARAVFPFFPDALQPDLRQAFQTTLETYGNSGFSASRAGTPWYDVAYRLYRLAVRETLEIGTDPAVTLGAAQATAAAYMVCLHRQALLASNEGSRDLNALPPEVTAACEEAAGVPPEVLWYED